MEVNSQHRHKINNFDRGLLAGNAKTHSGKINGTFNHRVLIVLENIE